jgi:hypothetical protein
MCNFCTRQRCVVRSTLRQSWPTEEASDIHRTGDLKACEESRGIPPFILNLWALEVSGQNLIPAALSYGKDPGIHLTGGRVRPKNGMHVCEKRKNPSPPLGFKPQTVELTTRFGRNWESPYSSNPIVPFVPSQYYGNGQAICYASYCQTCNESHGQYNQLLNKTTYCLRKLGLI